MTVIGVDHIRSVGVGLGSEQVFGIVRKVDGMSPPIGPACDIAKAVIGGLLCAAIWSSNSSEVVVAIVGETGGVAGAAAEGLQIVVCRGRQALLVVERVQQ